MTDPSAPEWPEWPVLPEGWTCTSTEMVTLATRPGSHPENPCRVYWGSHGCDLERGHDGDCDCGCCECGSHPDPDSGCVGKAPYYGPGTRFYGEDVTARGLPTIEDAA